MNTYIERVQTKVFKYILAMTAACIISNKVGVAKMAVVYGSIFIGHQIGAFLSAWLGGILVGTALGYSALWIADLCLCTAAAMASFKIQD